MIWIYDGTYEGLLACAYRAVTTGRWPDQVMAPDEARGDLFASCAKSIASDPDAAVLCMKLVSRKMGGAPLRNIRLVFLAETRGREMLILQYLRLGLRLGRQMESHLTDEVVQKVHELAAKVSSEVHRLRGLLRFQELSDGLFYARLCPDYDIIEFLPRYFSRRLQAARWIIHDEKRKKAVVWEKGNWYSTAIRHNKPLVFTEREVQSRLLWKRYFQHIALDERKNLRLQRQWMPRRYWRNLVEMEE